MTEPTLVCPHCKNDVHLTESLAAPLLENARANFARELAEKDADIAQREKALSEKAQSLAQSKRTIDNTIAEQVATKLQSERAIICEDEAKKARIAASLELDAEKRKSAEAAALLQDREAKLAVAQAAEADFRKKQRELADEKRELELTIEKRIQSQISDVREQAKLEVEEALKLKVSEKELTISALQKQIEILRQKAEQGSQQLQGEVQELELEMVLRQSFPIDGIEPVPKGEFGGDVLHRIMDQGGRLCGTILWECKRTKNWSDGWLIKLREDQRAAKAEISVIVSHALPKGIEIFDQLDGVWIVSPRAVLPIATALRHTLLQVSSTRHSSEGQETKTQLTYQYLTGPQFRQRVEAIVEAFTSMQDDLNRERQVITKQWAKRQKQIDNVISATVGMWGDLQGISGKSLQELEGLDFIDEPSIKTRPDLQALQTSLI